MAISEASPSVSNGKLLRVGFVAEGTTDYIVLDALAQRFIGTDNYVTRQLQPPQSAYTEGQGPLGGGWKGVLKWCESIGSTDGGIVDSLPIANYDLLIIHVDADIAGETDLSSLNLSEPCPPAQPTCNNIRRYVQELLGSSLPRTLVLCVPAQCTEAWVLCALHKDVATRLGQIECLPDVDQRLIGRPDRLVRSKGGSAKKSVEGYRKVADKIAAGWPDVVSMCPEAARFEDEFRSAIVT
jgi:hypothetical protein